MSLTYSLFKPRLAARSASPRVHHARPPQVRARRNRATDQGDELVALRLVAEGLAEARQPLALDEATIGCGRAPREKYDPVRALGPR